MAEGIITRVTIGGVSVPVSRVANWSEISFRQIVLHAYRISIDLQNTPIEQRPRQRSNERLQKIYAWCWNRISRSR